MDKYKTSELGKALKKVYRGEMTVDESVKLAESEIAEVFRRDSGTPPSVSGVDTGKYGEIVGVCPACGKNVVRGRLNYGCMGFEDGCRFRVGVNICHRDIPISEVRRLLAEGSTQTLGGFISKNGRYFKARLVMREGNAVFDFTNS